MLISADGVFVLDWLPKSITTISNPLEREFYLYLPPLPKFTSFNPATRQNFRDPPWGGVWIFSGTTQSKERWFTT